MMPRDLPSGASLTRGAAAVLSIGLSAAVLPGCDRRESHSAGFVARYSASCPGVYEGCSFEITGRLVEPPKFVSFSVGEGAVNAFAEITFTSDDGAFPTYLWLHRGEVCDATSELLLKARPAAWISPSGEARALISVHAGKAFIAERGKR